MAHAGGSDGILDSDQAQELVKKYIDLNETISSTQELIDSGVIARLKGYTVHQGKVSDSIFGGTGNFRDKKSGEMVSFENPPLQTKEGVPLRIMIRTARISTHDISRGEIPFKDQTLALNHNFMRKLVTWALGTSQFEVPGLADNSIVIAAENLNSIMFENVMRAYNAKSSTSTSLYQHYIRGDREFCGHKLPGDLIPNGPLPYVMDTPSTKTEVDESISSQELIKRSICNQYEYDEIRNGSLVAFGICSEFLRQHGIILVDTKLEHGCSVDGSIKSQDEIFTMDSSRFWLLEDYNSQLEKRQGGAIEELAPKSYSKEFARGFSEGDKGYTDDQRLQIAVRYIEGIQHLLGTCFTPDMRLREERVVTGLEAILNALVV